MLAQLKITFTHFGGIETATESIRLSDTELLTTQSRTAGSM